MRLRKKWWAETALLNSKLCLFEAHRIRGQWRKLFALGVPASLSFEAFLEIGEQAQAYKNEQENREVADLKLATTKIEKPYATQPLHIELGCGRGTFVQQMSLQHPDVLFVAFDIETNALVYVLPSLREEHKKNLRFAIYNIENIEEVFSPGEVDQIYISFCNPWPKLAHHKRRLTHPRQLVQYQKILKLGGRIQFKTDDENLYLDSLAYFPSCGFKILAHSSSLAWEEDPQRIMSDYERKWREQKVSIKYILAELENPNIQPDSATKAKPLSQQVYLQRKKNKDKL